MWCRVCLAGCTNCASVAPNTFFMDDEHGRCGTRRHAVPPTCIIRRQIDTKDILHAMPLDPLRMEEGISPHRSLACLMQSLDLSDPLAYGDSRGPPPKPV